MATIPAEENPTPQSIARYVKSNAARAKKAQQMHHEESVVTRETDYKGHHIVVRTQYEIEIDGHPLMGHMGVNDEGAVHYHPIPNVSFASALDMVKRIIDVFPDDFGPNAAPDPMPGMDHRPHRVSRMAMKKVPTAQKAGKSARKRNK